jgi:ubiquinone/menaquinone biosynthesis C-methylase UbiE
MNNKLPKVIKDLSQKKDRFKKISDNCADLSAEVFFEQGLDHKKFEESVFENVKKADPNFQKKTILDIGVGDGGTSESFIKAGCKKVVGIDLNSAMLKAAKEKLGDSIKLSQMDAIEMDFMPGEFSIIITGAAIHNIPKKDRTNFWKELLRLSPDLFIAAEKITDPDPKKHQAQYNSVVSAIKKVYGEKHKLYKIEKEWLDHYECDERERLELDEIEEGIGEQYDVEIVFEMGMYKTIIAKKISIINK